MEEDTNISAEKSFVTISFIDLNHLMKPLPKQTFLENCMCHFKEFRKNDTSSGSNILWQHNNASAYFKHLIFVNLWLKCFDGIYIEAVAEKIQAL